MPVQLPHLSPGDLQLPGPPLLYLQEGDEVGLLRFLSAFCEI